MMTLADYQVRAHETAVYPSKDGMKALAYLILGLNGEAGETANTFKKYLRGDHEGQAQGREELLSRIRSEIGDVLWYVSEACTVMGVHLEEVARANLEKLKRRQQEGTIKGDKREENQW